MMYEELRNMTTRPSSVAQGSAIAAVEAAVNTMAAAIVVLTLTGQYVVTTYFLINVYNISVKTRHKHVEKYCTMYEGILTTLLQC